MKPLFQCVHLSMADEKQVGFLMCGVRESLFARQMHNPLNTVAEFTQGVPTIEKTLRLDTAVQPLSACLPWSLRHAGKHQQLVRNT